MPKRCVLISAYACLPPDIAGTGSGEATLGYNIAREMSKRYDVHVITQTENRHGLKECGFATMHYTHIPFLRFMKGWEITRKMYYYIWQIAAYLKARRLHRKHRFDLAHHATYANGWMPSFIGALLPVPFVWGPLGGGQRTPPAFYRSYTFRDRAEEFTRLIAQTVAKLDPFTFLCRKRARAILVCNQETKQRFFRRQAAKVCFFPVTSLGDADLAKLNQPKEQHHTPFRVLMAGRFISLKGFHLGIQAFKRFSKNKPDAELIIVGEGPLRHGLKRMAQNANVRFLPWLTREELFTLMKSSSVFLFPSLRDGGGAVVVEAMAAGTPIVCFDLAGPAVLVDQTSGIKVPARNPHQAIHDIARSLGTLHHNHSLREQLGRGAQQRACAFSWRHSLADKLSTVYERALGTTLSSKR